MLDEADSAIIWRGPLKHGVIQQFLRDCNWGDLDFLVVDSPPGTGDEPLSIARLIPEAKVTLSLAPKPSKPTDRLDACPPVVVQPSAAIQKPSELHKVPLAGSMPSRSRSA